MSFTGELSKEQREMKAARLPCYTGSEEVNTDYHHGRIPYLPGVRCYQVVRANREHPGLADGTTGTYKHGADLTWFHGKFYLQYLCTPRDEHEGEGYSVLASSRDGREWEDFTVSFPVYHLPECRITDDLGHVHEYHGDMTAVMHQRMSFYRSSGDRCLLSGFYGYSPEKWIVPWDRSGIGRVVRELYADGSLGPIYFIRPNYQAGWRDELLRYPLYKESPDKGFVAACDELLSRPLVTQCWAEENGDAEDIIRIKHPKDGKYQAFCSYHVDESTVVGLWKHSYVSVSSDGGSTFATPVKSRSLVMSGQKIWGQKMPDGAFTLVYDPTLDSQHRYPMCAVRSDDGFRFDRMRLIHGWVPPMRYAGFWKDFGPQYMRGIAEGLLRPEDHPDDNYIYLAYSVNKEDIWIAHIPVKGWDAEGSKGLHPWNLYQPKWGSAEEMPDGSLLLKDSEPFDCVRAVRTFGGCRSVCLELALVPELVGPEGFHITVSDRKHTAAGWIRLTCKGRLQIRTTAWQDVCEYSAGHPLILSWMLDADTDESILKVEGKEPCQYRFYTDVRELAEISFSTGEESRLPDRGTDPETLADLPDRGKESKTIVQISLSMRDPVTES